MADEKKTKNMVTIGQYLLAKDGKTKYLKLAAKPNADEATKKLVADLVTALGGDVIYVNLMDQPFKDKYKVPDFVKGSITVAAKELGGGDTSGVNF